MTIITTIGLLAGLSFALCGLPQALLSYKQGHSEGIAWPFLNMWLFGEIGMLAYTVAELGCDPPSLLNYAGNLASLCVILKYKIWPRISV